jgi:hypothetical protein
MLAISSQRKTALGGSAAKPNRANSARTIELNNGSDSTKMTMGDVDMKSSLRGKH